jgi:hypothetical protein
MGDIINSYHGINDILTQWEVKTLIEEKIGNHEFEKWIYDTLKLPITTLDEFIDNMNVRVILQYQEFIDYLNSDEYKAILEKFYYKVSNIATIKDIDLKLIKYINRNIKEILKAEDNGIKSEILQFILQKRGFSRWEAVIDDYDSVGYLGFNYFDETQRILKNVNKELHYKFIKKILFPLNIHCGLEKQLEIINSIRNTYRNIADEYENIVMSYLEGDDFRKIDCYHRNTIINTLLQGKCFTNKNQILLNNKLANINIECDRKISNEGLGITISSKKYMESIQNIEGFREKIFMLIYEQGFSLFELMMVEREEKSLIDLVNYNGIRDNKYKNSTLQNISYIKSTISINTLALINNYKLEFWKEVMNLGDEVEAFSNITVFLSDNIDSVKFLIENKRYFIAASHIAQIIERLLRELYFSIEYGIVGFLKSSNLTLGSLLKDNEEKNSLRKLFSKNEINALNFFLNDRENGENIRNKLAHYTINTTEFNEIDVIFLLDILLFILLKVDYQGVIFENRSN